MFGSKPNSLNLELDRVEEVLPETIREKILIIHQKARENQEMSRAKNKIHFDKRHRQVTFNVGNKVMIRSENRRRGKLDDKFKGPYTIIERESDNYTLSQEGTNRVIKRHVESLKPFFSIFAFIIALIAIASFPQNEGTVIHLVKHEPLVWQEVFGRSVYGNSSEYDLTIKFVNPCNSFEEAASKLDMKGLHLISQIPTLIE